MTHHRYVLLGFGTGCLLLFVGCPVSLQPLRPAHSMLSSQPASSGPSIVPFSSTVSCTGSGPGNCPTVIPKCAVNSPTNPPQCIAGNCVFATDTANGCTCYVGDVRYCNPVCDTTTNQIYPSTSPCAGSIQTCISSGPGANQTRWDPPACPIPAGCPTPGSTAPCSTNNASCPLGTSFFQGSTCNWGACTPPTPCGCTPTNSCAGHCGNIDDGCGRVLSCGDSCAPGTSCGCGGTPNMCGCSPGCGGPCPCNPCNAQTQQCINNACCSTQGNSCSSNTDCCAPNTCQGGSCQPPQGPPPTRHDIRLKFTDVDDDGYVWADKGTDTSKAIAVCTAKLTNGVRGFSECSLDIDTSRDARLYVVRMGNGGYGLAQGNVEIDVDGQPVHNFGPSAQIRECGWWYRLIFTVNLVTGSYTQTTENVCPGVPTDACSWDP